MLVPVGGAASAHSFSIARSRWWTAASPPTPWRRSRGSRCATAAARCSARRWPRSVSARPSRSASPLAITGLRSTCVSRSRSAPARRLARLRPGLFAASSDVLALDDLTCNRSLAARAAGGLPFEPLTSPAITLFEKPHGYPNPFRVRGGRGSPIASPPTRRCRAAIYTLLGDLVREPLADGRVAGAWLRGLNEVPWDGKNGRGDGAAGRLRGAHRGGRRERADQGGGASMRLRLPRLFRRRRLLHRSPRFRFRRRLQARRRRHFELYGGKNQQLIRARSRS